MTQNYDFLESNVNVNSMGGDQPDMRGLFRTGGDASRGTARPNDPNKNIPADGQLWFDSIARVMNIYSVTKTGGPGWIPLFEAYDGAVLNSPVNPAILEAYPKGSIYLTTTNVNPREPSVLGYGQWELIGQGRALCGVGTNGAEGYTISEGEQLGLVRATLAPENLPAHRHNFQVPGLRDRNVLGPVVPVQKVRESGTDNYDTGVPANAGQPFVQLPPYSPLYVWLRGTDNLTTTFLGDSSLTVTLDIEAALTGTTVQSSGNLGNLFNQPQCPSGGTPAQGNTPWTRYQVDWVDTATANKGIYWDFTVGGQFEVLQTFSFFNNTTQQTLYTFNQGLTINSGIAGIGPNAAFCIFDLVTDTSCQYHGLVTNSPNTISYTFGASSTTSQPPAWWGDEIIVVAGSP